MRPLDPRLMRYARSTRAFLMLSVMLGVATAGLIICQAWLLTSAVVDVFVDHQDLAQVRPLLGLLVVVALGRGIVSWGQEAAAHRASAAVKQQLREQLLAQVVALGPAWLKDRRTADLTVLATRGLDSLDAYFARYLPQLVLAAIVPVTVLLVVLSNDLLSAVVIALTLPLIPIFMILIGWTTQRQQDRQWRTLEVLAGHFLDVLSGLPTLKVFGRAKAQAQSIRRIGEEYRRATMKVLRISFLSSLVLELLASISVALVAVEIGIRLVDGSLTLFVGLFVLVLAPDAYLPLRLVGQHFHASQEGLAAAERVFAVLEEPVDATDGIPAPSLSGTTVRVDGVGVVYPDRSVAALEPIDLEIRPGEVVALVGPSGAGKSTLLDVLLRFRPPTSGEVVLEAADGSRYRLSEVDPGSWREQVAWLPQRPAFVAGTVADNVRLGRPSATDGDIARALAEAGADFVAELPDGQDTVLGEGGAGLSTGQRQRVALARVLVRPAVLVLLDEPTAGLDGHTEQAILEAIDALRGRRTVVVVAHRPALVGLADRVVHVGVEVVA